MCIRKVKLRIRRLPEEKIAQTKISARTDEEVDRRIARRIKRIGKKDLINLLRSNLPCCRAFGDGSYGTHDLVLAAIVRRQIEVNARIPYHKCLGIRHPTLKALGKAVASADEVQAHLLCVHLRKLLFQEGVKEPQEEIDFALWTLPVLRGERVDREHLNPHIRSSTHDPLERACPLLMSRRARFPLCLCPTPVSIHNNRDMARHTCTFNRETGRNRFPRGDRIFRSTAKYLSPHHDPF